MHLDLHNRLRRLCRDREAAGHSVLRNPMMMRTNEQNDAPRVKFERPLEVRVMAIDGTWHRESFLIHVSDSGAEIEVTGHAFELTEFLLMLTSFGTPVFRRCKRE